MRRKNKTLKPMDQPNYSYWRALYMAFYSTRLYLDVIQRWRGVSFGYFLLIMLVISVPWSIQYTAQFKQYIEDEIIFPMARLPLLMIQNGNASMDEHSPYFVNNKAGLHAIEINMSTALQGFPGEYPSLMLLVTNDRLYFRAPAGSFHFIFPIPRSKDNITVHTFDKNDNEVFSGAEWVNVSGIQTLKRYSGFFIYPMVFAVFFGFYGLLNFVLASVGRIISIAVLKYHIGFLESLRLTWVASTAPSFILNAIAFSGVHLVGYGYFYMAFVVCYFSFAVLLIKHENRHLVLG